MRQVAVMVERNSNKKVGDDMKKKEERKSNKKPSKIKKLKFLFKRWNEISQEKKQLSKQEKNVSIKPKGYFARKVGVVTFWILFSFMFLVVMVTIFSNDDSATANENPKVETNKATTPEAIQFAENFLKEYFTWTASDEGNTARQTALAKYLSEEIRENEALDVKNYDWNSKYIKSEIKRIDEKGENLAYLTFQVNFEMTKKQQEKKKAKKQEIKQLKKYIEVPIAYDKKGDSFGIYDLPKFTYIFDETTLKEVQTTEDLDNHVDLEVTNKIEEFLPTFFKTYAEDEKDKLNYMTKNDHVTNGLNGTMKFKEVNNYQIYKKGKNKYIVFAEVTFEEPETKIPFFVNHQLEVVLEKDRVLVSGIDSQLKNEVVTNKGDKNNEQSLTTEEKGLEKVNP